MMSMGEGVANVLGFHSNTLYTIHGDDHEMVGNISSTQDMGNLRLAGRMRPSAWYCAALRVFSLLKL